MKKISKYLVGLSAILLLAGCGISIDNSNSNAIASSTIKESSGKPGSSSTINPSSSKNNIGSSTTNAQSELNILTINDTHGYLETSDSNSISKIAAYMDSYDENALRISVGDMFQGTGLSNLTKGKAMIEVMNAMNIDAMVIGNHEFDWGIDTILGYFDGNEENGEAKFPLLAANVVDSDSKPLPNSSPYLITNKNGLKVGLIGVIGEKLESSISASSLGGYSFLNTRPIVEKYVKELRNEEKCDIVILGTHCGTDDNYLYSGLDIDFIFNGHTHQFEVGSNYIQAGCYAKGLGVVTLTRKNNDVSVKSARYIYISKINNSSTVVDSIVEKYKKSLDSTLSSKITKLSSYSVNGLMSYTCKTLKEYFNVDFAFMNSGGFRNKYGWKSGMIITYNDMITMFPFDNEIKLVTMKGSLIKELATNLSGNNPYIVGSGEYKSVNGKMYIGDVLIEDNKEYRVAAIDYIFDKEDLPFLSGTSIEYTTKYVRDILVDDFSKHETLAL